MHELGDLTADGVAARCLERGAWLQRLAADGRAFEVPIPVPGGQERRWIAAEDYLRYRDAFALPDEPPMPLPEELLATRLTPDAAREAQLRIWARTRGPWTRATLAARYAFPEGGLDDALERLVEEGLLATGSLRPGAREREWCDRRVLERIHRRTLSLLRREVQPVSVPRYAEFLAAWQGVGAPHRAGKEGLVAVMQQLRGLAVPGMVWERDLLLARVTDYRPALLDDLCVDGDLVWWPRFGTRVGRGCGSSFAGRGRCTSIRRRGSTPPTRRRLRQRRGLRMVTTGQSPARRRPCSCSCRRKGPAMPSTCRRRLASVAPSSMPPSSSWRSRGALPTTAAMPCGRYLAVRRCRGPGARGSPARSTRSLPRGAPRACRWRRCPAGLVRPPSA